MNRYQDCANRPLLYFLPFLPRGSAVIFGFWGLDENAQVWHSSDLDSAPQNLLETAKKLLDTKKRGSDKKKVYLSDYYGRTDRQPMLAVPSFAQRAVHSVRCTVKIAGLLFRALSIHYLLPCNHCNIFE